MRIILCLIIFCSLSFSQNDCKKGFRKITSIEKKIVNGENTQALTKLNELNIKCDNFLFHVAVADLFFYLKEYKKALSFYSNANNIINNSKWNFTSLKNYLSCLFKFSHYSSVDSILNVMSSNLKSTSYIKDLIKMNNFALNNIHDTIAFNPISLSINSDSDEYFPSMSTSSDVLIFTYRDRNSILKDEDFFISRKQDNKWGHPQKLGNNINSDYREGSLSISLGGDKLYFASCNRPDSYGGCDIYFSSLLSDTLWSNSYNLGSVINTKFWESQPSISADGRTLFFASDRVGGYGGTDIWVSKMIDGVWQEPINLGPLVNSKSDEYTPFIHFDNETFYFASKGKMGFGGFDLFISDIDSNYSISNVRNLGYPINTSNDESGLIVAIDGKSAYYNSFINDQLDIYSFILPKKLESQRIGLINGNVIDSVTRRGVESVELIITSLDKKFEYKYNTSSSGYFSLSLPLDAAFNITIASSMHDFFSKNYFLEDGSDRKNINIVLNRLNIGNRINLTNIQYKFDDYSLEETSLIEIERFASYLIKNSFLRIEIRGHTDDIGSKNYNKNLSLKRAESVYQALIQFGVSSSQMIYNGYGNDFPILDKSTDEARFLNRRTEIKIIDEK